MVEHLYNSQQQKNDFFSFHRSVILVSFMTLFYKPASSSTEFDNYV